jgi:GAF domain-containing protein
VAANAGAIVNGNPSVDLGDLVGPADRHLLKSALAIPLESEKDVNGVLTLFRADVDAFTSSDLRNLTSVSSSLGRLVETSMIQRQSTRRNVIPIVSQPAPKSRQFESTLLQV